MNPAPQRIIKGKNQHKDGNYTLEKARKKSFNKAKRRQAQEQIPTFNNKMTGNTNYFSLISLNINGLNYPIKRHTLIDWLHKQDTTFGCLPEIHLRDKDRHYLRVKGWKTIFKVNGPKKLLE